MDLSLSSLERHWEHACCEFCSWLKTCTMHFMSEHRQNDESLKALFGGPGSKSAPHTSWLTAASGESHSSDFRRIYAFLPGCFHSQVCLSEALGQLFLRCLCGPLWTRQESLKTLFLLPTQDFSTPNPSIWSHPTLKSHKTAGTFDLGLPQ